MGGFGRDQGGERGQQKTQTKDRRHRDGRGGLWEGERPLEDMSGDEDRDLYFLIVRRFSRTLRKDDQGSVEKTSRSNRPSGNNTEPRIPPQCRPNTGGISEAGDSKFARRVTLGCPKKARFLSVFSRCKSGSTWTVNNNDNELATLGANAAKGALGRG